MATEIRTIVFTQEEVRAAVAWTLSMRHKGLTGTELLKVQLRSKGPGSVSATVQIRSKTWEVAAEVEPGDLLSALLHHCSTARIPLAVRAQKRLELNDGALCLISTINLTPVDALNRPNETVRMR